MNYRGSRLGLVLLASQIFHMGLDNIPPVTLAVLGINVYLFLFPLVPLSQACVSVQQVVWFSDWRRLVLSPLHHVDDLHLYFNMVSFLYKGRRLERELGQEWFIYLLVVFSLLTDLVYLLLEGLLTWLTLDDHYSLVCGVGFSGVLFALKVLNNYYYPGDVTYLLGFPVSNRYASWVELVLIQVIVPEASFVGHLSGILVGLLYTRGPLRDAMKTCADFVMLRRSRTRAYYRYTDAAGVSGYAGPAGENVIRQRPAPVNTEPYTGGLTEDEQLEEAIRNSVDEQGASGYAGPAGENVIRQRRAPVNTESYTGGLTKDEQLEEAIRNSVDEQGDDPPPCVADPADEARAEVVRQMRLRRFERPVPPRRRVYF